MMIKGYCRFWYKVTNFLQKNTLDGRENLSGFFVQSSSMPFVSLCSLFLIFVFLKK